MQRALGEKDVDNDANNCIVAKQPMTRVVDSGMVMVLLGATKSKQNVGDVRG